MISKLKLRKIIRIKRELSQIIGDHAGKTLDEIIRDSDRNNWMSADQAKDYGLVDNVIQRADT